MISHLKFSNALYEGHIYLLQISPNNIHSQNWSNDYIQKTTIGSKLLISFRPDYLSHGQML